MATTSENTGVTTSSPLNTTAGQTIQSTSASVTYTVAGSLPSSAVYAPSASAPQMIPNFSTYPSGVFTSIAPTAFNFSTSAAPASTSIASTTSGFPMYPLGVLASSFDSFNGKDPKRYFDKVELRAKLDNLSESNTLNLVKLKLTGDAYEFFNSDPSLDMLGYTEFKNKILARFVKIEPPGSYHLELMKIFQRHDEGIAEFTTRLRVTGVKALKEDLKTASPLEIPGLKKKNDDLILNQFKVGLRRELLKEVGVMLLREPGLTLEKAEEIVKLQETTGKMLGLRRNTQVDNIQSKCFICGESNHLARGCLQKRPESKEARTGACFACGRTGHFARECNNTGGSRTPAQNRGPDGAKRGERHNNQRTDSGSGSAPRTNGTPSRGRGDHYRSGGERGDRLNQSWKEYGRTRNEGNNPSGEGRSENNTNNQLN